VADEKDRLGEKLQNLEKAREDQWAAQQDRELMEQLRRKQSALKEAAKTAPKTVGSLCPHCQQQLVKSKKAGVTMLTCQAGDGAWIDKSELDKLLLRLG
jgi:hypothetical protein